ncbi:MAG: NAD(P)H-dependent oxidoreductase subunit E [Candidatus Cybelea sp.]
MDLHFTSATATAEERDAVDAALAPEPEGKIRRHLVLPLLHAVQDRCGWISAGALNYVSERLSVAPADVYGVATFYKLFSTTQKPGRLVHVCDDIACVAAGAEALCREMERSGVAWERSPCLGQCDRAPATLTIEAGALRPAPLDAPLPHVGGSPLRLLKRVGAVDPERLDEYRAHGGFDALHKAFELGPQRTVKEIVASKLLGRGGAAFPTGRKMEAVAAAASRPHYLVCNADESEPGTFKDRMLMEQDPFAIVEAMAIAAYAAQCERAYVYVRGEYPLAAARIENAIAQSSAAGLLDGVNIKVRRGAGAYICGEETALFNSIEGKRGEPRNKPPFPTEAGLFGKPTLVNNVETLANLPLILRDGGDAYARTGTPESTGTRLFCLSGSVARPGLYEVPHGTTLRALVDLAGGIAGSGKLRAILLGGAAGALVTPESLTLRLSFEDARAAGVTLGSGVVMLFDDRIDLVAIVRRIARFFRDESCGQCVPCRVGTVRQDEALARICNGPPGSQREHDLALLGEIGAAMRDASICGLGQTAANAVESAVTRLRLFEAGNAR